MSGIHLKKTCTQWQTQNLLFGDGEGGHELYGPICVLRSIRDHAVLMCYLILQCVHSNSLFKKL